MIILALATPPYEQNADTQSFWIAVRTFFAQESKVSSFLQQHQIVHFIPLLTRHSVAEDGTHVRQQYPAVHNLLFIQLNKSIEDIRSTLSECPYPIFIYRKLDHPDQWCEISEHDMLDLRLICDSDFSSPVFLSSKECNLGIGNFVRVVHGPLKGVRGQLVRKNKKYYIVKSFEGLGVMVAVSRWCCAPDTSEQPQG